MEFLELLHAPLMEDLEAIEPKCFERPRPFQCDSFIARSVMQKAIRRGDARTALRAAATITRYDPKVVWRRLLVTVLEDIGPHEAGLIIRLAAVLERRRFGIRLSDDWPLMAALIRRACNAIKCQSANDLHNVSLNSPEAERWSVMTADMASGELLELAADKSLTIVQRNHVVIRLTERAVSHRTVEMRQRAIGELVGAISQQVCRETALTYQWALEKSRLPLATASILISEVDPTRSPMQASRSDLIPLTTSISGIPAFALDQYTRAGRAAIRDFVDQSFEWKQLASDLRLSRGTQIQAVGELLFRVESAVLDRRREWGFGIEIAVASRRVGCFLPEGSVDVAASIVRANIPMINGFRRVRFDELNGS